VCVGLLAMRAVGASAAPTSSPASLADKYKLTNPAAITRFQAGNTAYKSGVDKRRPRADRDRDLERAIAEYTAGQTTQDRPVFDFNLGLAYKALGRTDEAVEHLQRFLDLADETVSAEARADAEKKLAALDPEGKRRAELARKRAAVFAAPAPSPDVPPTSHVERTSPAPSAPPPAMPMRAPPPEIATTEAMPSRSSVHWSRIGGWGMAGAGVIGAGVTTWLVIDAQNFDSQANDAQANHRVSERQALSDRADSRRRSAVILGVGSGALLASGALILFFSSGSDPAPTRTGWNLGIMRNGVAMMGRF
jgi:tetratricopeptide (TPR) repeat protein